ncbi:hypothetical protein V1504DRAFT_398852 [Lipomyces starkeyi]
MVDFVQESGRAGRNNKPAKSIVLLRNNWHPNYEKLPDADAQVIDDFVSPHGFCRRYTIGQYMDVVGFTCMTHVSNVQLCDICTATQAILTQSQFPEDQTQELKSLQLPEGPIPVAKRLKPDETGTLKQNIKTAFSCITTEYRGCVMCALARQVTRHANYDAPTILDNHGIALSTFNAFNEQLSFARAGICHGCGLNLRILNGLPEHVPGKACIYTVITRLVCYEIFMNGRLSVCIKDIDRGFLDTSDIKSFGKWLNVHPLGMLVNNLTKLVYNWTNLRLIEDGVQTPIAVHVAKGKNNLTVGDINQSPLPIDRDVTQLRHFMSSELSSVTIFSCSSFYAFKWSNVLSSLSSIKIATSF